MLIETRSAVNIIDYEEQYANSFMQVHKLWFESDFFVAHFKADDYDYEIISNPSKYIIDPGGHIFLAEINGKVVGTAALITRAEDSFELSKIVVLEKYRGLGIGAKLIKRTIAYSKLQRKKKLWLDSIRILKPALALFKAYGFEEIPLNGNSPYARADIRMSLDVNNYGEKSKH